MLPSAFDYDPFDDSRDRIHTHGVDEEEDSIESLSSDPAYTSRVSDYFQLLEMANESSSRPSSPPGPTLLGAGMGSSTNNARQQQSGTSALPAEKMAEGYFKTFFQEEYRLGMDANGSVYLCQVSWIRVVVSVVGWLIQIRLWCVACVGWEPTG